MALSLRRFFSCFSARSHGASCNSGAPSNRGDPIDRLPDDILSSIMYLLPTKDAARTGLLSSKWRGLWTSTQLVLDDSDLILGGDYGSVRAVTGTVSRVIEAHPGPFCYVKLTSHFTDDERDTLAGWIRALATKGVRELALVNIPWAGLDVLPYVLLRCRSLERLHISTWRFPDTAGVLHGAAFPRLLEFILSKSVIREQDLENMLACSPVLQTVAFVLCGGAAPAQVHLRSRSLRCVVFWQCAAEELAVVAAPLLQRVILWASSRSSSRDHRMRIKLGRASGLRAVGYLNPNSHELLIGDTVIKAGTSPEVVVPSVNILGLSVRFGVTEEAGMVSCLLRYFPNTGTLHVMSVQDPWSTTEHGNFEFWKGFDSVACVKSSIKKVVIHGFRWEDCEIEFLKSMIRAAQVLEKIYIFEAQNGSAPDGEVNCKLSMLASLNRGGAVVILAGQDKIWSYAVASDLSCSDPFDCRS